MIYYWIIALLNSIDIMDLLEIQSMIMIIFSSIFIIKRDNRLGQQLLLAYITYPIYLFISLSAWVYIPMTALFLAWSIWIQNRPEIGYLIYNHTNLCLAFYKGKNTSIRANLTALLGLNVTSVDILYKDSIWRYKHGLLIKVNHSIDEYILFDTGIKPSVEIDNIIDTITKIPYKSIWYKSNCVELLRPLLKELNLEPKTYLETIPSFYIRRILENARRQ